MTELASAPESAATGDLKRITHWIDGRAVARIYAAKGRPSFNPLIAHVPDLGAARRLAVFNAPAERLAEAFWPGPLTLVLPKTPGCPISDLATAGLDKTARVIAGYSYLATARRAMFDGNLDVAESTL